MSVLPIPSGLQTRLCIIGDDVLQEIPRFVRETWPNDTLPIRIVADGNTWRVAGEKLQMLLQADGLVVDTPYLFPAEPPFHAEYPLVERLREPLKGHRPIAVGSGTINDLVKRTTFELGIDGYLCCATACSVDGYTSAGAAITKDGLKQTLACPAPLVIAADNAVLATAPFEMTAAGYADLAAKVPAGGDWFIADAVGQAPLNPVAWGMVQKNLQMWLEAPEELKAGDAVRFRNLFEGLAQTGFAMQYMKDSRPASGAEHLYSHCWEMRDIRKDGVQPSHGFKVAVGTLLTTALQEEVYLKMTTDELSALVADLPYLSEEVRNAQVTEFLGGTIFEESARKVSLDKLPKGEAAVARRELLLDTHAAVAEKLRKQLIPFDELKARFASLGCPTSFEDIGLTPEYLRFTTYGAGMIRNRYTIHDAMLDLGITDIICQRIQDRFAR